MIISDFNLCSEGGLTRASATFVREDSGVPPINIYVQTTDEFKEYISADPNSFLLASVLAAWKEGEKRVLVKGSLCPVLLNNLEGAFMMLKSWYPRDFGELPSANTGSAINHSFHLLSSLAATKSTCAP